MSTPTEQARAVLAAERFLRELAAREAVPTWEETRMAHALARRARAILRHLPTTAEWASVLTNERGPPKENPMPANKDWTTPAARAELAALHAEATPGWWAADNDLAEIGAEGGARPVEVLVCNMPRAMDPEDVALVVATHNAVPQLLARIERDETLLRRASLAATALIEGEHELTCCESAVEALRDDLRAAGFAPEEE